MSNTDQMSPTAATDPDTGDEASEPISLVKRRNVANTLRRNKTQEADATGVLGDAPEEEQTAGVSAAPRRRRASRAAGPAGSAAPVAVKPAATEADDDTATTKAAKRKKPANLEKPGAKRNTKRHAPPPRRLPNRRMAALIAYPVVAVALILVAVATSLLYVGNNRIEAQHAREQRFVDTASQMVVNLFSYTPETIDESVDRFVAGTSGPLRDKFSIDNNAETLKAIYRDTNATSEAVVNAAALEKIDEVSKNASVLITVRVTVTDIDAVNLPSDTYRLRVIVNEDDNGYMTSYDLLYPDGGN